ncbi:MAG: efflux RND transporter permease subunit, partial [Bdellovibrionaceae bacterium]|nr:efflux RND transporter permease subunit [Pseudobdellovibrionaceae bacterium]
TAQQLQSEKIIKSFAEVENVFSRVGTAEVATDPMGVNESDTFIILKDHEHWPKINGRIRSKSELAEAMIGKLSSEISDQEAILSQPIQMRFNDLLGGARTDLSIKIYGDDLKNLKKIAENIKMEVEKIPGAADVSLEQMGEAPILKIFPKYQYLTALGVPTSEVLDTVNVALAGQEAGVLFEGFKRIPIIVRLNESLRENIEAIKNLPVGLNNSGIIPLKEATDLSFEKTQQVLFRETSKRRTAVLINLRGRDTQSFVEEAKKTITTKIQIPESFVIEWAGNYKNLQQAKQRMQILTPLALILVMVMVYMAFKSMTQTFIVLSCIPLALSGGIIALIAYRLPMSISAGIGFIALAGISVLNGVVLVNVFNDLRNKNFAKDSQGLKQLVTEGTLLRLRPVLMTALVDIFGFLPMMLSSGIGSEVQKPLATVVIGGVISSTLLTLILLPILYFKLTKKQKYNTQLMELIK